MSADRRFITQKVARFTNVSNAIAAVRMEPVNGSKEPFAIIIQRSKDIVYINATSTRECTFALGFAREYA